MLASLLTVAFAQDPTLDLQRFVPLGHAQGFVAAPTARQSERRGWEVQLLGSYGAGGLVRVTTDGDTLTEDASARALGGAHLRGAYGVTRAIELALQAPVAEVLVSDASTPGLGDVRLAAQLRPLGEDVLGVALVPFVRFPTGTPGLTRSLVSPGASLALGKTLGVLHLTGSVGVRLVPIDGWRPTEVGLTHELTWAGGVGVEPGERVHLGVEVLGGQAGPTARFTGLAGYRDAYHLPVEVLLGGRLAASDRVGFVAGGTFAVSKGVATPSWRAFLGVNLRGQVPEPVAAEPVVLPEPPTEPPPESPHQGSADRDRDGVLDVDDACPLEPEDRDGFLDGDGCPDPDNDQDTVPDTVDLCPLDAEPLNGIRDDDGCPDDLRAVLRDDRIHVLEEVHFATGSAGLTPASEPVLEAILATFEEHPEIRRVRIEGHTDAVGDPEANLRLSTERARAVRTWLLAHGVEAELEAEGFGPYSPVAPNDTEAGRERNRRVEIWVLEAD